MRTIKYRGKSIDCFGEISEESTVLVAHSGGCEDFIDRGFKNWSECVKYCVDVLNLTRIEQLETD